MIFHYQLLLTHDFPMIFAWCSSGARQSDHRHELSEAQVMAARCGGCYHRWPRFLQLFKVKRNMNKIIWMEYEQNNVNEISTEYGWNMHGIQRKYECNMNGWVEYEWNMNGVWMEYEWNMHDIWMENKWNRNEIWMEYEWSMKGIGMIYEWSMNGVWMA